MRFQPAAYGLAFLWAGVVIPFQIGTLRSHSAWLQGTSTTLGHVDNIANSTKVRVIDYSYEVDGKKYTGEDTDRTEFDIGPQTVTYAKADPSVSTIKPEGIASRYDTAVGCTIAALLPLVIMGFLEVRQRFAKKPQAPLPASGQSS